MLTEQRFKAERDWEEKLQGPGGRCRDTTRDADSDKEKLQPHGGRSGKFPGVQEADNS